MKTAILAGLSLATLAMAQGPETVEVGSKPTYKFQKSIQNGAGVESLADLAGKPVMIEFWGTN